MKGCALDFARAQTTCDGVVDARCGFGGADAVDGRVPGRVPRAETAALQ